MSVGAAAKTGLGRRWYAGMVIGVALGATAAAQAQNTAEPPGQAVDAAPKRLTAPKDASVYIGWPGDGTIVHSTRFKIWFGTRNFGVAPAGTDVPGTGHHHLIVDAPLPPLSDAIPNDKNHLHFGRGQTETVIDLPPGRHTLQLLMGAGDHVSFDPPVLSKQITILVQP